MYLKRRSCKGPSPLQPCSTLVTMSHEIRKEYKELCGCESSKHMHPSETGLCTYSTQLVTYLCSNWFYFAQNMFFFSFLLAPAKPPLKSLKCLRPSLMIVVSSLFQNEPKTKIRQISISGTSG